MKPFFLLVLCLCFGSYTLYAQDNTALDLKGVIVDSTNNTKLQNASIILLKAKDSILYSYMRTDKQGQFVIPKVPIGNYVLLVTYPGYADYTESFVLDSSVKLNDFGALNLMSKSELLKDVIVSSNVAAIRIKGDTTEFIADSFKVAANANIEDLLKKFPGFSVDKDGKISAQGETIKKVLVDGEEFFGDDPTLVTKNLRADMVDKVQLFDKKSDQATFSGVDDGVRDKTLNVKLKADKKRGIFGRAESGVGTEGMYQNQAMLNQFKNKRKLSAYGTFANTGKTGLGFQEAEKYGASDRTIDMDGGMIFITGSSGDDVLDAWDGNYNGEGIPRVISGGAHYDNKWDEGKHTVNGNYKIGESRLTGSRTTLTQTNLDNGQAQVQNASNTFDRQVFRQKADAFYEVAFDSTFSLKASVSGSMGKNRSSEEFSSRVQDQDSALINSTVRHNASTGENQGLSSNILLRKKLKKKGRTLSLNLSQNHRNSSSTGFLNSNIEFSKLGTTQQLDQKRLNDKHNNDFNSRLNYTEPLSEFSTLAFNYQYFINKSESDMRTYNKDADSAYSLINNLYSNHFEFDQNTHRGGLSYNYNKNNKIFNIGSDIGITDLSLTDLLKANGSIRRNFKNLYPTASINMQLPKQLRLWARYYGNTTQPQLTQLQPILTTEDTMNIYVGNPELKAGYSHGLNANIGKFDILSGTYFGFNLGYNQTFNPVVTNTTTDIESGRRTYHYFNTGQPNSNFYFGSYFGSKIKKWDLEYGLGLNGSGNKYVNSVNDVLYNTTSNNLGINNRFRKVKDKKYDIGFDHSLGYRYVKTTQQAAKNNGFNYNFNPYLDVFFGSGFQIHSDLSYNWQQKTETFNTNFNRTLWHAWIGKKFLKKENLLVKVSAFDLLNRNKGFDRNVYNNVYTQSSYTTIPRHFMLSVIWDFNKMGGTVKN